MSDPVTFVHADTVAAVQGWLAEAAGTDMVAVDTETTGWDPHADRLLLVQVATAPDRPVLVLDATRVDPRVLRPLMADGEVVKVFHHGSFDLRFLRMAGLAVERVADTMLAQQLLDGGAKTGAGLSLAGLAAFRLGMTLDKDVRVSFAEADAVGYDATEAQLRYAAQDAAATWGVFDQQRRELVGHGLARAARLEFAALPVLADLQLRGVAFDAARWAEVVGALEEELPALADAVQQALVTDDSPRDLFGPTPVNLDSPEQVVAALARVGVPVASTREHVLRDHGAHPAVAALLAYRQVSKVTSNWGGDWAARVIHPATGRIHADWRQIVGTGRIACSDPNLTQVPKDARYRSCFGGQPGRALVVADYSQQELRILAAVSGDEALAEVFHRGGDLHRATAAMAFCVPEADVTPAQRAAAKALNFGLMYGMGAPGFAAATGRTLAEAQATMRRYFAAFPKVADWLARTEAEARQSGRVRTLTGRLRVLEGEMGGSATLARNAPIQGAGADMTKLALAAVERLLAARFGPQPEYGVRPDGLVLTIHDELVAEVPAADAEEAAALVVTGMEQAAAQLLGDVPAAVDVAWRTRWAESPAAAARLAG
jgi:DNA polymerase I